VKHCALTNVNSDRGFESCPEYEVKPPDSYSSLETHGQWILDFPDTGRIWDDLDEETKVTHNRECRECRGCTETFREPTKKKKDGEKTIGGKKESTTKGTDPQEATRRELRPRSQGT
jgi:hypothetical protein